MTERPILFSGPMVQAILDGTKTQTRRVMKIQPPDSGYRLAECVSTTGDRRNVGRAHWLKVAPDGYSVVDGSQRYFACPYGLPGDQLWVRETWVPTTGDVGGLPSGVHVAHMGVKYAADRAFEPREQARDLWPCKTNWKPSIHMPRWASRLTLEVTAVRVQRVQEISEEDAKAEGADACHGVFHASIQSAIDNVYRRNFAVLWNSINAARGFGWDANPWVWAIAFKRV